MLSLSIQICLCGDTSSRKMGKDWAEVGEGSLILMPACSLPCGELEAIVRAYEAAFALIASRASQEAFGLWRLALEAMACQIG